MEETILTPNLKLTLIKTVENGSLDLDWAHVVRSDAGATSWRLVFVLFYNLLNLLVRFAFVSEVFEKHAYG
jgi:hypothetical protein